MSMVINLVEDHNIYLCEGGPVYNGGVQPAPITYLTQWKIVGNSEVHGQEIWSCGEYSEVDGKYHIFVLPQGGSIADIALDEPLRMVGNVADTIEYADNVATVTRYLMSVDMGDLIWSTGATDEGHYRLAAAVPGRKAASPLLLTAKYPYKPQIDDAENPYHGFVSITTSLSNNRVALYDADYNQSDSAAAYTEYIKGTELICELATPTTELVDAPQIQEADSYSMVISQGAKAISWSSFITE